VASAFRHQTSRSADARATVRGSLHVELEVVQDDPDGLSALNGQSPAAVGIQEVLPGVDWTGDVAVVVKDDQITLLLRRLSQWRTKRRFRRAQTSTESKKKNFEYINYGSSARKVVSVFL